MSNRLTTLDAQLQEIALADWEHFVELIGDKAIRRAKICLLKRKGKSLNQIAVKLHITKRMAEHSCNNCHTEGDSKN